MKHFRSVLSFAAVASLVPALLTGQSTTRTQPAPPNDNAAVVLDPEAVDALRKMGEYLRTLKEFQVKAFITQEEVLTDDQKVQFGKTVDLVAKRPNKIRMQIKSDRFERLLVYDGKTFSMFSPRTKYYASEPAPPTIVELANKLEDDHDLELPLVDLFRWGTGDSRLPEINAAKDLGASECGGVTCQHYAFRQDGMDWEVWIQNGDHPLPRRIVLNTLTDDERPQYTATYTWNLAPSFNDDAFVFEAPADAKRIKFADVKTLQQQQQTAGSNKPKE